MKNKIACLSLLMALSSLTSCSKVMFRALPEEGSASLVAPTPTPSPVPEPTPLPHVPEHTHSETVKPGNKQVDFLLVMDDSNSMLPDLKKLAASMSAFMSSLDAGQIDWQMCLTTTRALPSGGKSIWGLPLPWANYTPASGTPSTLLKKGAHNLNSVFTSTVDSLQIGGPNSGDERAIKATYENFAQGNPLAAINNGCYREGAAKSVIIISDEDERSVGGDKLKVKPKDARGAYQPLESSDLPETLFTMAHTVFGEDVRFTFNSIIVKPGDTACETTQDQDTSPSHPGSIYSEMSNLTSGGIGSICDHNFAASLNTFKDKIINSLSQITLQCDPDMSTLTVIVNGLLTTDYQISGNILKFASPLTEGTQLDLSYDCRR
ncbi:MAG: hypothetical protein ACM3MG_11295 [Bacillota bacterium]